MSQSLFSTYSTGENRVTASILAVLRSLSLGRIERLLGALMEESEFELVRFQNQPSKGGSGVPDAIISSSCRVLVETKITRGTLRRGQIERHLKRLDEATETLCRLLLLTPDEASPPVLEKLDDRRLVWASFATFDQAIDEMLGDKTEVISEREAFLLRELQAMLAAEGLVGSNKDVVVVPARNALPEYHDFQAYVCQPGRTFQPVRRMAFYAHGKIHPLVPEILSVDDEVVMERGRYKGRLGQLVESLLDAELREEEESYKVFLLSAPDDERTVKLAQPIFNNLVSGSGRTTAFTQNQRYVPLERLQKATKTSELVEE